MQTGKPKILIVEDDHFWQDAYRSDLGNAVEISSAYSVSQARELFLQHAADIKLIVMDACVPGNTPTTLPLVREIRAQFTGPMIGASLEWCVELRAAGCDYSEDNKGDVPKTALRLLAEMSAPRVNRPEAVRGAALPGGPAPAR
jgi:hypothetical protein